MYVGVGVNAYRHRRLLAHAKEPPFDRGPRGRR